MRLDTSKTVKESGGGVNAGRIYEMEVPQKYALHYYNRNKCFKLAGRWYLKPNLCRYYGQKSISVT